jgi:tRNA G10  N-methylase Trm11
MNRTKPIIWHGCYDGSWNGLITPESFSHPAKYSRDLIDRIFRYMLAEGMLERLDTVVDPFGGIGGGGIVAAGLGLRWIGVELEQAFVDLGRQNFELHRQTWETFDDPLPVLVQGDSRQLRAALSDVLADGVVCSPPYAEVIVNPPKDGASFGNQVRRNGIASSKGVEPIRYGTTPGQLGAMKAGSFDSIVSSPPYAGNAKSDYRVTDENGLDRDERRGYRQGNGCFRGSETYGGTEGQLGEMPTGQVDSVVTSRNLATTAETNASARLVPLPQETIENSDQPETFWTAARAIIEECHHILKPGGWAVFVCKDFVRNKARVPFCEDWCKLLDSCGFQVERRVHAMLVKETTHTDLFGDEQTKRKERKSFFRRLAEKKGSPRIDYEEVIFARKCQ